MSDSATIWTVAHQAPLSTRFSSQEYWSGLLCPPPGNIPNPGVKSASLMSPLLAGWFFTTSATWDAHALVDLDNYCLLCSHPFSLNSLNFSAHAGWFKYEHDWCYYESINCLSFSMQTSFSHRMGRQLSGLHCTNSCFHHLVDRMLDLLPRGKTIMGHSDPIFHPIRNFKQVPNGKWFSTKNPRLRNSNVESELFIFLLKKTLMSLA